MEKKIKVSVSKWARYTYTARVASDQHSRRIIIEERMRKPRVHDITIRDTYTLQYMAVLQR